MSTERVKLDLAMDGKVHVFFFYGTDRSDIRFVRIEDLDHRHPHDQLNAALIEMFPDGYDQ